MAAKSPSKTTSRKTQSKSSSNGAGSKTRARASASRARPRSTGQQKKTHPLKAAANKAGAPALAVGAAAAGVVGGLVLKGRTRRRKFLGVSLPGMDAKSVAKTVGKASKQLGQTSKTVSKDIERVGDQAERLGNILG